MKIVGFAQLRNELENGNLKNWFKTMEFCDSIYIYDQDSTDGSKEYYKKFKNTVVIESPINDFTNEIKCKDILLIKLLKEQPDVDWIIWLDGDTIIDARLTNQNAFILKMILRKKAFLGYSILVFLILERKHHCLKLILVKMDHGFQLTQRQDRFMKIKKL